MKILIISDTHGNHDNLDIVLEQEKPLDLLIHLGDAQGKEDYIEVVAECSMEVVAGNNDFYSNLPREQELKIGKYKAFLTHGHHYYVNAGTDRIKKEGINRMADIVMFGHTHKPVLEKEGTMVVLNPGSISYPRQEERCPSYIIMELDENEEAHFCLKYL